MKKTTNTLASLVLVTLAFASQAQASSRSTVCSSADGNVKIQNKMAESFVQLTEVSWDSQYNEVRKETVYDSYDIRTAKYQEKQLLKKSHKFCDPKTKNGSWMNKTIVAMKVIFTKDDGGLFTKETSGVSEDLKSVEAHVICEYVSSGIGPCL